MDVQHDLYLDSQRELNNCDFVKTSLMMLVVFYHSILFWTGSWFTANQQVVESSVLQIISNWLNSFHIYGFTLVSGYIFGYLKLEKGKYKKYGVFLVSKAQRLLIPYCFAAIFWVIPVHCVFYGLNMTEIIQKYVWGTAPSQLWFLLMLFNVFAIFWPLTGFFATHDYFGVLAALGFYGLGFICDMILPNYYMIWTAFQYIPLFWLGFKLRQYGGHLVRRMPAWVWVILDLALFALVQVLADANVLLLKMMRTAIAFVLHIVGAIMAFVVLQNIADKIHWKNRYFSFLSKRSMAVYLIHQ